MIITCSICGETEENPCNFYLCDSCYDACIDRQEFDCMSPKDREKFLLTYKEPRLVDWRQYLGGF